MLVIVDSFGEQDSPKVDRVEVSTNEDAESVMSESFDPFRTCNRIRIQIRKQEIEIGSGEGLYLE